MEGNRAVDLAAPPEQAPQGELDFSRFTIGRGHAGEDLGRVVESIVDKVVEPYVVVAGKPDRSCGAIAATEYPGGNADRYEGQCEQDWRELDHSLNVTD